MQNTTDDYSQSLIDTLFSSTHFIAKFKELQSQTYHDLILNSSPSKINDSDSHSPKPEDKNAQQTSNLKIGKLVELDNVIADINELVVENFRDLLFKEINTVYDNKLTLINIAEEIENIKQSISKMGQASSFVTISAKTLTTYQSITPDKELKQGVNGKNHGKGRNNAKDGQTSMFIDEDEESSIDLGLSRKNLMEDRVGSFSFMNSFLNQNKMSPQEEEIINERINASISKVQSSIDDRITQLEKEFSRRIEQVMKTMGHFIQMMNETDRTDSQSPFKKAGKRDSATNQQIQEGKTKKVEQPKLVSSKSTVILSQNKKAEKPEPIPLEKVQQQKQPPRSNKLASFFGLGRLNTSQK